MRQLVVLALLAFVLAPAAASAAHRRAHGTRACTAFGKRWAARYNKEPGPIRIVAACCAKRSARTRRSACEVMVTVRKGPGAGTFGCSVATVAANDDILANRPLACKRRNGVARLP